MQKDLLLIVHFAHLHSHVGVIARLKGDIQDTGKGPNTWSHPISLAASVENVNLFQCPVPSRREMTLRPSRLQGRVHSSRRRFHVTVGVMEAGSVTPQACAGDNQRL